MGLALLLEANYSPFFAESRVLIPLGFFGVLHGSHEWLEMFFEHSGWLTIRESAYIGWLRIGLLTISFSFLVFFGLGVLRPIGRLKKSEFLIRGFGILFYNVLIIFIGMFISRSYSETVSQIDVLVRYFLGVTGALLAGWAMFQWASKEERFRRKRVRKSLQWAGFGLCFYSISQTIVPKIDFVIARSWNTTIFSSLTGLPVQVVRAAIAVWITICILVAIKDVEEERRDEFFETQRTKLEALDTIRKEMAVREAMRKGQLRHIVKAQEEERARIARELHDETAQLLTAFSLNLATISKISSGNPEIVGIAKNLQTLTRRMSRGIYDLVHDLRPAQLDELGLVAALQFLIDETRNRFHIHINLKITGERVKLDRFVEIVLFRVVQEAINNIVRHSGVEEADIELAYRPSQVFLGIYDRGKGFDPGVVENHPKGWGLIGIRERVETVGGEFKLATLPNEGTRIEISLPVDFPNLQKIGNEDFTGEISYGKNPIDASG